MTREGILAAINKEYSEYRSWALQHTPKEVWDLAFRINAWKSIYEYFKYTKLKNETLERLYHRTSGNIIATLVERYIRSEYCDIAQHEDIEELILNFVEGD